jgi:AcrR family transcriptional regulator
MSARTPLTKELILRTAIGLADESGLEALSMRNLAGRLGVTAMSLYNHVANKDEILEGMIDAVFDEIEMPHSAEWKEAILKSSISAREAMVRHPWATSLMMSSQGAGPSRLRHGDWLLGTLRSAGLSDEMIFHAYHALESHLLGWTLQQLNFPYQGEELADIVQTYLRDFPVEDYPNMSEHIRQHITPDERKQPGFEFALRIIIDGLEQARDVGPDRGRV